MKIKVKDEMDNIKLKCKHKEVVLINEALNCLKDLIVSSENNFYKDLNSKLFDRDEFENNGEVIFDIYKMLDKFQNELKEIYPF